MLNVAIHPYPFIRWAQMQLGWLPERSKSYLKPTLKHLAEQTARQRSINNYFPATLPAKEEVMSYIGNLFVNFALCNVVFCNCILQLHGLHA